MYYVQWPVCDTEPNLFTGEAKSRKRIYHNIICLKYYFIK